MTPELLAFLCGKQPEFKALIDHVLLVVAQLQLEVPLASSHSIPSPFISVSELVPFDEEVLTKRKQVDGMLKRRRTIAGGDTSTNRPPLASIRLLSSPGRAAVAA